MTAPAGDGVESERARAAVLALARERSPDGEVTLGDAIAAAALLRDAVDGQLRLFVAQARDEGATWADIGAAIGVTAQAAQQRYGDRRP